MRSNLTLADFCPKIPPLGNQNELVYNICLAKSLSLVQAVHAISTTFKNDECTNAALPFLCNATFSLCSDDSFVADLNNECIQVRDNNCTIEWRVLENMFDFPIPSCESFALDGNLTFAKAPSPTCPDQFGLFCGSVCLPLCKDFSQYSEGAIDAANALTIVFQAIGLLSGVVTLIACIMNRKKM